MPMDITTLGIAVDSRQVKQADKDLNQLGQTAGKTEKQTKGLTTAAADLSTALKAVAGALAIREVIQMADSYKLMEGRLRLVTTSAQNLATVQKELFSIAQESRVSLEATVDLYSRLARSTKTLGVGQKELLAVTETISKSFIISGSGAQQTSAAVMQLGQAFASGVLRGDEFNSVMENSPRLAEAIAKSMGVTIGQLRKMAEEGKLTSEKVYNAIKSQGDAIDAEFTKMPKTVGQAMTQIENSLVDLVGSADKAVNGTGGLTQIMGYFSEAISDNKREIIEFGGDFLKAMQMMGAGVVGVASGALGVIDGLAGGLMKALQTSLNTLILFINGSLSAAETATNRVRGLFGGDQVQLGRISAFTFGDEMLTQSAKRFSESANAFKTMGVLAKEIAMDTVVLANGAGKLETATGGAAQNMTKLTKEQEKAIEQQRQFDHDIAQGRLTAISERTLKAQEAIEQEAEAQRKFDHDIQQGRLSAISERTVAAQEAMDKEAEATKQKWDDIFSNVSKSMDAQFFDAMTGKFKSFGDWFKDFWSSITNSLLSGLSRTLADVVMGGARGGIQNVFSSFGGLGAVFGTPAALQGAVQDAAGFTTTTGGTVFDAAGKITKEGSDVSSVLNAMSTAKTLYGAFTGGLSSIGVSIAKGFGTLAQGLNAAGFTSAGAGVSNFGLGAGSIFTGGEFAGMNAMGAGQILGGAGVGALGGYALGSLGDRLFGASTRAGQYGAIGGGLGGAIGTVVLPGVGTAVGAAIGSALGSVIGGMFGKTKQTGAGIFAPEAVSAMGGDLLSYTSFKKKSWFSSKSWTNYKPLSDKERQQINSIFTTYDYLLGQLGDMDKVIVGAGKYSGSSFFEAIDKAFIRAFVDNPALTDTFYTAWTELAKKMGTSAQEAFSQTISGYINYQRGFEVFGLERMGNSLEALRKQAGWAQGDFDALANLMGATGVTVDNFSTKYEQAIKANFTPETIQQWQSLGDALKSATSANDRYTEALKQGETQNIQMRDAFLSQTADYTALFAGVSRSSEESKKVFIDMLDYLRRIYTNQQFGVTV